jgi:hypothetical protein
MQVREHRNMSAVHMFTCCYRTRVPIIRDPPRFLMPFRSFIASSLIRPPTDEPCSRSVCLPIRGHHAELARASLGPRDTSGTKSAGVVAIYHAYPCVIAFGCQGLVQRLDLISIGARARYPRRDKWWLYVCLYQATKWTGESYNPC